ncbi:IS5 family transposase, partial [Cyanobacterium aponinum FACHB-4101]|uniref:IS5 family transposase n=1 Tax=Cyanobacterium aponinum TaxID=379064 RepID=UPI00168195EC
MYLKNQQSPTCAKNFVIPNQIQLDENNQWVVMANLIPWQEFEQEYANIFDDKLGAPAKSFRMALGALIIQQTKKLTDRQTVEEIRENPYLQYFIGLENFSNKIPFSSSMMVHFRKRIGNEIIDKVNQQIVLKELKKKEESEKSKWEEKIKNKGKLILDASCTPADITYPTDLGLLNQARLQTEKIIDKLYSAEAIKVGKKPRTDRKTARKNYLNVAKKKKVRKEERREAIKLQLKYIKKNLISIEKLNNLGINLSKLSKKEYKKLLVVAEVYRQQKEMYEEQTNRIDNRIVSITQPHIRPIVRGKTGSAVEFGGKISVSVYENYVFLDKLSWDNFNESTHLIEQVEKYHQLMGYYPATIYVDQIYRTRENRRYCKEKGIKMSGKPLGRPKKNVSNEEKKKSRENEKIRNRVEGKFGEGKRRYGLNKIMTKLPSTSMTVISLIFLVMNLSNLYRQVLLIFLCQFSGIKDLLRASIKLSYQKR